ncbi:hypothetical protein HPP92_008325 [Vanilla planifolia]|uniref:Uncharacterized protein n=1 Tax=Vanilla planifolia TaxID=51239 RepID=A0A835R636_VANPL|nr:hypothetical protein HPP92_008325 [Vanilla planifolia]
MSVILSGWVGRRPTWDGSESRRPWVNSSKYWRHEDVNCHKQQNLCSSSLHRVLFLPTFVFQKRLSEPLKDLDRAAPATPLDLHGEHYIISNLISSPNLASSREHYIVGYPNSSQQFGIQLVADAASKSSVERVTWLSADSALLPT